MSIITCTKGEQVTFGLTFKKIYIFSYYIGIGTLSFVHKSVRIHVAKDFKIKALMCFITCLGKISNTAISDFTFCHSS